MQDLTAWWGAPRGKRGRALLTTDVEAVEKIRSRSTQEFRRDMNRDSISLDFNVRLHCDLLADHIVERGSGNIFRHQQD